MVGLSEVIHGALTAMNKGIQEAGLTRCHPIVGKMNIYQLVRFIYTSVFACPSINIRLKGGSAFSD